MVIGVPKEIKEGENRIALTPAGVQILVREGHSILIEKGGGLGSGLTDEEYISAGAEIVLSNKKIFLRSDLIIKVKEPLESEWPLLRGGQILFTYLHLASSEKLTRALLEQKIIGIAYETVEGKDGDLPLLVPMSEVAGRMAIQVAARFLETDHNGTGVLLSGIPGVPPAEVVILGCGIVGLNAAKIAVGLGAHVTILDISLKRLEYVDNIMHGNITTIYSTPHAIQKAIVHADVLIGAVLVSGGRAPILVTDQMVSQMKPGAVIVDVSIDQGGCIETMHLTTHKEPVYSLYDVIHYGVPNIPASVPRTSTYALTNATLPYIQTIASKGIKKAATEDTLLAYGINCAKGVLTHRAVAESFRMKWKPWHKVI